MVIAAVGIRLIPVVNRGFSTVAVSWVGTINYAKPTYPSEMPVANKSAATFPRLTGGGLRRAGNVPYLSQV